MPLAIPRPKAAGHACHNMAGQYRVGRSMKTVFAYCLAFAALLLCVPSPLQARWQKKAAFSVEIIFESNKKDGVDLILQAKGFVDFRGTKLSDNSIKELIRLPVENGGRKQCVVFISIDEAMPATDLFKAVKTIEMLRHPDLDTFVYVYWPERLMKK